MTSQSPTPFEASLSQQSPGQPPRRRQKTTMTVLGLVVVVALVAGFFALRHNGSTDPASVSQSHGWNSISDNWSGYAETTAQTGQRYTAVTAAWTVPSVTTMSVLGCASNWAGIGGATSRDLIQLGTSSCSDSSTTGYNAWYEILPAAETIVPSLTILPGDRVVATLQLVSGPSNTNATALAADYASVVQLIHRLDPGFGTSNIIQRLRQLWHEGLSHLAHEPWFAQVVAKLDALFSQPKPSNVQIWKFTFNVTSPSGTVQTWSKTLSYASSLSSVEWITEAPTLSSGISVLPNYGIAHFESASANGGVPSFTPANQILLADPHGQASIPSAPAGPVDAFNTCYFPTQTVTACAAP
ncbi:MAG TPA: G1 family glutamic endopeptidase [Acidimicrobiales bacterium]|nr:G1 family glutamic endopeptidase [Acidimicrobiales bacterium]